MNAETFLRLATLARNFHMKIIFAQANATVTVIATAIALRLHVALSTSLVERHQFLLAALHPLYIRIA